MDYDIQVIFVPVTDVDRAKAFYVDQVGFVCDHDQEVDEGTRFVQLTPPGSRACSIAFGRGLTTMEPGSQQGIMAVVADADATLAHLRANGVTAADVDEQAWGRFVSFSDPDGNSWALQQLPTWG